MALDRKFVRPLQMQLKLVELLAKIRCISQTNNYCTECSLTKCRKSSYWDWIVNELRLYDWTSMATTETLEKILTYKGWLSKSQWVQRGLFWRNARAAFIQKHGKLSNRHAENWLGRATFYTASVKTSSYTDESQTRVKLMKKQGKKIVVQCFYLENVLDPLSASQIQCQVKLQKTRKQLLSVLKWVRDFCAKSFFVYRTHWPCHVQCLQLTCRFCGVLRDDVGAFDS